MLAVPILIQVFFNSGLAYWLNRRLGEAHSVACPSALIGASNFFELAVAAAISLFGFESGAALATVVGVLIEVPVMLLGGEDRQPQQGLVRSRAAHASEHHEQRQTITIYHNPACGTSRNTLALIRNSGVEPAVIEYLKTPPAAASWSNSSRRWACPRAACCARRARPTTSLKLDDPKWTDDELIDFMLAHPILINRPIVVTPLGMRLCRPSEAVLDILPSPQHRRRSPRRMANRSSTQRAAVSLLDLSLPQCR